MIHVLGRCLCRSTLVEAVRGHLCGVSSLLYVDSGDQTRRHGVMAVMQPPLLAELPH